MLNDMPDIMNVKQLQYALHIGRSSAYKLLKSNQIEHFFIGRSIRILKKSVVEFVCRGRISVANGRRKKNLPG